MAHSCIDAVRGLRRSTRLERELGARHTKHDGNCCLEHALTDNEPLDHRVRPNAGDGLNRRFCDSEDAAHGLSMQATDRSLLCRPMCQGAGALSLPGPSWSGAPVAGAGSGDFAQVFFSSISILLRVEHHALEHAFQ